MDGYPYVHRRIVEFRDCDAGRHVNNAVYLTYLETARVGYLQEALGEDFLSELSLILAHISVDFRSPARFSEPLSIGARVPRIGTKSFEMEHEVRGEDGRLVAEAASVLVAFDYEADVPMAVPPAWRERIETYEARSSVPT